MHNLKGWMITCIVLAVLAAFFFFCLRGYSYISYALLFIAFFIFAIRTAKSSSAEVRVREKTSQRHSA